MDAGTSVLPPTTTKVAKVRPVRSKEEEEEIRLSKVLAYILRHGATKEFLKLRPDGFVRVSELVRHFSLSSMSRILFY